MECPPSIPIIDAILPDASGYFHSEDTAKLKLGIVVFSLESGKWHCVAASVKAALDPFTALFEARFEAD